MGCCCGCQDERSCCLAPHYHCYIYSTTTGDDIAGCSRRSGLLPLDVRPLPHLRLHLSPHLWPQGPSLPHHTPLPIPEFLIIYLIFSSSCQSFLIVSDPDIAKHILRDNSKAYSKVLVIIYSYFFWILPTNLPSQRDSTCCLCLMCLNAAGYFVGDTGICHGKGFDPS